MLFKEWFKTFFDVYVADTVVYGTACEYQCIYKYHYSPIIDIELAEIKPLHIQFCMNTTKGYSNSRQRRTYFHLHRIFDCALSNGYIAFNPVNALKPPKKIKKLVKSFDSDDVKIILSHIDDNKNCRMISLMLYTGLRRGELLALHWDNINLEEGYIDICQSVVRCKGGQKLVNTTKSRKDRIIYLKPESEYILRLIRLLDSPDGFLFQGYKNRPLCLCSFNTKYTDYIKSLGIAYLSPHKMRHTFATFMLRSGADLETLREILGHSDLTTTQMYLHCDNKRCSDACKNLKFE